MVSPQAALTGRHSRERNYPSVGETIQPTSVEELRIHSADAGEVESADVEHL